ncbi:MAG TPA: alanine racemase [Alphaproteobacteria bacterium]|nr:alanine racemase [Rhodospirillaceae bacterium]HRJ12104.1 alanine racemase [Alphaproteobacteria bacterium]
MSVLRPAVVEVSRAALSHNLQAIHAQVGNKKIMAVVKADAYGHGLTESAKTFAAAGADYFGVALVEEGITLRRAGITQPILVMGGLHGEQIADYLDNNLDITASSADKLRAIDAAAMATNKTARVHLKIDTGMGRIGVQYDRLPPFIDALLTCKNINIIGVFSHLATAEETDLHFARTQIQRFETALAELKSRGVAWQLAHIANSAAVLTLPESYFDMVRPGLALYGVAPTPAMQNILPLHPAMSLKSKIVYFKVLHRGQSVSYGQHWKAEKDTRIVTIPLGYGDGYPRALSGKAEVLIGGKRYPIAGNICMDQMMADIRDASAYNGDEVVLIGPQGDEIITAGEIAAKLGAVPHEILTSPNLRVPRVYL